MKKHLSFVTYISLSAFLLVGCATPQQRAAARDKENRMYAAINKSKAVSCENKSQCDRIYRIASDMVVGYADMKVQTQGENNIATFGPISYGDIGMSAQRTLKSGASETVKLSIYCRGVDTVNYWETCADKTTALYETYQARVDSVLNEAKPPQPNKRKKAN